jgi:cell division protein FtsZ
LGDRLRVTVIATGFENETEVNDKPVLESNTRKEELEADRKKVHDLDRSQIWMFESDNSLSETKDIVLKTSQVEEPKQEDSSAGQAGNEEERPKERELVFTGPFNKIEKDDFEDDVDDMAGGLFGSHDDEFEKGAEQYGDQIINEEGMMERRTAKQRLQEQAEQRKEKLKNARKQEMTKEEFNEKWALPAYLRRGVKIENVPHSSEQYLSKFNLNDDNGIIGSNKFLHDNVD